MVQPAQPAAPGRKRRTEEAIRLAMAGDWKAAAAANEALLKDFDDDVESANRLGKAYTELGQPKKAIKAYERALEIDRYNSIARKNLDRLQQTSVAAPKPKAAKAPASRSVATTLLTSAKAAEFRLQQANPAEISKLEPGDSAELQPNNRGVAITTEDGIVLGYIEPAAGLRLRRLIEGGNRYDVTIRSIDEHGGAIVFIREVHRDSSLAGQASFLASAETRKKAPRAYTRRSALIDEDDPEITDVDDYDDEETPLAELQELGDAEDDDAVDALGIEDDDGDSDDLEDDEDNDESENDEDN